MILEYTGGPNTVRLVLGPPVELICPYTSVFSFTLEPTSVRISPGPESPHKTVLSEEAEEVWNVNKDPQPFLRKYSGKCYHQFHQCGNCTVQNRKALQCVIKTA